MMIARMIISAYPGLGYERNECGRYASTRAIAPKVAEAW